MTRILALTNWYPPHHYGGYELSCFDVMTRLEARGHDVLVLCSDHRLPGVADPETEHETRIRRRLQLYIRHGDELVSPPLRRRRALEIHNQRALRATLAEFKPEVVAVWHMGAMSLGLLTSLIEQRLPIVYAVCDDWLLYEPIHIDAWARLFERSAWRRWMGFAMRPLVGVPTTLPDLGSSGAFCFVSDATRKTAESQSPWTFPVASVVYSGIDGHAFPIAKSPDERPWRWRLLYTGRFDPRKGTETLVRALGLLPPETTLAMYGRGGQPERIRLEGLAVELGVADRITFGQLDREELADRYAAADVLVFPVEWDEPFGLSPVEAMACGTPVVATGRGGSAEFLQDGVNCVLFPAGDPGALASAIRRVRDEPQLRRRMAEGGLRTAAALDVDRLADTFEHWYVAAAKGFPAGQPEPRELPGRRPAADPAPGDGLGRHRQVTAAAVAGRDPGTIKRLYVDLGADLLAAFEADPGAAPALSSAETHPVVSGIVGRSSGLVLDAGCGPNPVVALALAASPDRTVVAFDIGVGTVVLARAAARHRGLGLLGVVGDVERLPFRSQAFEALVCDDTVEHVPDDRSTVSELARVLRPGGRAVLATPNRHSADVLRRRFRDAAYGRPRPASAYFVAGSHLREYTWPEFEDLVRRSFRIRSRAAVGWERGWKSRVATKLVQRGPLRRVSQMIVLEAEPR